MNSLLMDGYLLISLVIIHKQNFLKKRWMDTNLMKNLNQLNEKKKLKKHYY